MTSLAAAKKLSAVSDLIRLPKQYGTLLVLWPTLWSLFIASDGRPSPLHLAVFVLGSFLMRSAGCAINDIADRGFDPLVERTKSRPLASGRLTVGEALFIFFALSALSFILVLFLNPLTIALSFIAILLAGAYPFVKRISHFPQVALGMAFGWGAVMAWSAVTNEVGSAAVLIFIANIFWALAYDTIYALMDKEDDIRVGVKSTAIFFGRRVYTALTLLYTAFAACLFLVAYVSSLGLVFLSGVLLSLLSSLWIVWFIRENPLREARFRGFVANAAIGGLILFFIVFDFML